MLRQVSNNLQNSYKMKLLEVVRRFNNYDLFQIIKHFRKKLRRKKLLQIQILMKWKNLFFKMIM